MRFLLVKNTKVILIAILVMLIAVVPITVVSAYNAELAPTDAAFSPRLTAPSGSNKYYYSGINTLYAAGYGMPNCTCYAWGRAYEILGKKPSLSVNGAEKWWDYNKSGGYYKYGQTPKLGAIACWKYTDGSGSGHVAVVEKITSSQITFSNSEWGGRTFYLSYASVGASNAGILSSSWKFQGYIYILDSIAAPDYSKLGGDVYKVKSDNGINLRKGAGTSYGIVTAIPDATEIVVTATKTADGYTWGKTTYAGYTGWCVLKYTTLVYKQPTAQQPTVTVPPTTSAATVPTTTAATTSAATPDEPTSVTLPMTTGLPVESEGTAPDTETANGLIGDVNGDGVLSISDATMIQKYSAGMLELTPLQLIFGDLNLDGRVAVTDATAIQRLIAME